MPVAALEHHPGLAAADGYFACCQEVAAELQRWEMLEALLRRCRTADWTLAMSVMLAALARAPREAEAAAGL